MASNLEEMLDMHIRAAKLTDGMEREYRFAAMACGGTGKGLRQRLADAELQDWRLDFAWPDRHLAVEVEGGVWTGGRHTRGAGFEEDARKYNVLALLGWRLLRFTSRSIQSGVALQSIEAALQMKWEQTWVITA